MRNMRLGGGLGWVGDGGGGGGGEYGAKIIEY